MLSQRDLDIRIGFVIPQQGVVLRPVLLDQIAFQNQCFQFRVRHDVLKPRDMRHHLLLFETLVMRSLKILMDTLGQTQSLSHIDDLVPVIVHNINSRLIREFFEFFFNLKKFCHGI